MRDRADLRRIMACLMLAGALVAMLVVAAPALAATAANGDPVAGQHATDTAPTITVTLPWGRDDLPDWGFDTACWNLDFAVAQGGFLVYAVPNAGPRHLLGDLAVQPDQTLYWFYFQVNLPPQQQYRLVVEYREDPAQAEPTATGQSPEFTVLPGPRRRGHHGVG